MLQTLYKWTVGAALVMTLVYGFGAIVIGAYLMTCFYIICGPLVLAVDHINGIRANDDAKGDC